MDDLVEKLESECRKAIAGISLLGSNKKEGQGMLTALKYAKSKEIVESLQEPLQTEAICDQYKTHLIELGRASGTVRSNMTLMRRLCEVAVKISQYDATLPDLSSLSLKEAIRTALSCRYPSDMTQKQQITMTATVMELIAKTDDYPQERGNKVADTSTKEGRQYFLYSKIKQWISYDKQPQATQKTLLSVLEKALAIDDQKDVLVDKASLCKSIATSKIAETNLQKQADLTQLEIENKILESQYDDFELPAHVVEQFDALIKYRITGKPPSLGKASFKMTKKEAVTLERAKWDVKVDGTCSTGDLYVNSAKGYMRFLHCYHGVPLDDLDLSLLLQDELLSLYVEYMFDKGVYVSPLHLARYTAALAKPVIGYLSRYHVPKKTISYKSEAIDDIVSFEGIHEFKDLDSWQSYCVTLHRQLRQIATKTSDNYDAKDGKRRIFWMTKHKDGIEAAIKDLWKAIDSLMYQADHSTIPRVRYSGALAAAWFALELRTPLRLGNTTELRYLPKPPLHDVVKEPAFWLDTESGDFRVHVPRRYLKNRRASGKEIVDVQAGIKKGSRIHDTLEKYLAVRADFLKSKQVESEFLFFQHGKQELYGNQIKVTNFSNFILRKSESAFRTCLDVIGLNITEGINAHAMRHLVAQRILTKEPNNYRKAATALMDTVATIISVYGDNVHDAHQKELDGECD